MRGLISIEAQLVHVAWITKVILKSIKTKNKLFKSSYKCSDPSKIKFYKKYCNKLTHIKYYGKRQYYNNLLNSNENNQKTTWAIINQIIDCKSKSVSIYISFIAKNKSPNLENR